MTATTVSLPDSKVVLADHANAIRRLHKQTIENIIETGMRLTECKKLVGHGKWLPWLEREFGWTEQTALNYMRAAKLSKSKPVLDLKLPVKALYLLGAASTPKSARDEIIERANAGEAITLPEVKQTIGAAKARAMIVMDGEVPSPAEAMRAKFAAPQPSTDGEIDLRDALRDKLARDAAKALADLGRVAENAACDVDAILATLFDGRVDLTRALEHRTQETLALARRGIELVMRIKCAIEQAKGAKLRLVDDDGGAP